VGNPIADERAIVDALMRPEVSSVIAAAIGGVTSVGAAAPLASSGGTTPVVSLTGVVPITNGGTGSAAQNFVDLSSAQIIAGAKTFSTAPTFSAPLAVGSGGTGSAAQNFVDLTTAQSVAGVKTFSSAPVFSVPLGVASGGTGSATQNFVDLTSAQTVAGVKTFSSAPVLSMPLAVASGGTGSATQNFVDLSTAQTIGGSKTFSNDQTFNGNVLFGGSYPANRLIWGAMAITGSVSAAGQFVGTGAGDTTLRVAAGQLIHLGSDTNASGTNRAALIVQGSLSGATVIANNVTVAGAATGSNATVSATGSSDTNAGINFVPKGTGMFGFGSGTPTQLVDIFGTARVQALRVTTTGGGATMGRASLVAGTATVATTAVTANSDIVLVAQVAGGTVGILSVGARIVGTSFVINSSSTLDTSTVMWMIVEPN
jgi:hypothetical protein